MSDRLFLRVGAGAAIAGGVLALVGNLLHPRYNGEDVDNYHKIAGSNLFRAADFVLIPALILVVAGMIAVARSLHSGTGTVLSDYGRLAATMGGTIAIAQLGLETYAFRQQAVIFVGADSANQQGAFWATNAIDHLNTALAASWTIVLLGLVPLLLGFAMLRTHRYPAWLAVVGALGGATCLVVGCVNLARQDQSTMDIPFLVGSLLDTAWIIGAGALLLREDGKPATTMIPSTA